MKIRFAKNIDVISGESEIGPDELAGTMGIKRIEALLKESISIVTDIFKNHSEIKQVTLDTMTDEERRIIEQAETSNKKNKELWQKN